jgi:hypothetical protein
LGMDVRGAALSVRLGARIDCITVLMGCIRVGLDAEGNAGSDNQKGKFLVSVPLSSELLASSCD